MNRTRTRYTVATIPESVPVARLPRAELMALEQARPRTRSDCVDGPRPCPWMGCRHHLGLDVSPTTGSMRLPFGTADVESMPETCSLDVADRGEASIDDVGRAVGVSRQRASQLLGDALARLQRIAR